MSTYKRARGLSSVGDDNLIPLVLPGETATVIELYKGSKNFWRTRFNLELIFTYFVAHDCIQITGYESTKEVHTSTLYVSATIANRMCQTVANFEDSFKPKKIEFSRKRTKTTDTSVTPAMREYLCQYLLARIDMQAPVASPVSTASLLPAIGSPGSYNKTNSFKASTLMTVSSKSSEEVNDEALLVDLIADSTTATTAITSASISAPVSDEVLLKWTPMSSDVMDVTPENIINFKLPYVIDCPEGMSADGLKLVKRMSTRASDFEAALSSLQMEQNQLKKANRECSRLLNLTQLGAKGFANSYAMRIKREQSYSKSKILWHMAYRRTCTRNFIVHITERLNKIYNNYYADETSDPVPVNTSSPVPQGITTKVAAASMKLSSSLMNNSNSLPGLMKNNKTARHTIAVSSPKTKQKSLTAISGVSVAASRVAQLQQLQSAEDPSSPTATPRSQKIK